MIQPSQSISELRAAEQVNGRERETATFLLNLSFYIRRAWLAVSPHVISAVRLLRSCWVQYKDEFLIFLIHAIRYS